MISELGRKWLSKKSEVVEIKDSQIKKTKKRCKKKMREVEMTDETNHGPIMKKKKKKIMR